LFSNINNFNSQIMSIQFGAGRRTWQGWCGSGDKAADFDGAFYRLRGLEGSPAPLRQPAPRDDERWRLARGKDVCDPQFGPAFRLLPDAGRQHCAGSRNERDGKCHGPRHPGLDTGFNRGRRTHTEADEYARHCVENADWDALDHQYALYAGNYGSRDRSADENRSNRERDPARVVLGYGGSFSIRGDADHVARQLEALHAAGFDGVAMGFVNYLDELPYFVREVIPRLQRQGLRAEAAKATAEGS
jgi:FMNH2-dependent dimethyl sulfone monooxygenase